MNDENEKSKAWEDVGYVSHGKQHVPWVHEVKRNMRTRSMRESPLKEAWLAEQREKELLKK